MRYEVTQSSLEAKSDIPMHYCEIEKEIWLGIQFIQGKVLEIKKNVFKLWYIYLNKIGEIECKILYYGIAFL